MAISEAQVKDISLNIQVPPDLEVKADRQLFVSALSNLVKNGIKYSRDNTTVAVRARADDGSIVIEVEDHCGGLPPGKAEELFVPFTQRNRNRTGAGLGLSIVQRAVAAHHGKTWVRDLPGKGCVFGIELPKAYQ